MGQQVELVMVGPNKGKTMTVKNVPFTNGRAWVSGPDDSIGNILKYLRTFGAVPAAEAPKAQADIDAFLASQGNVAEKAKKVADLKAQLAAAEAEMVVPAPVEETAPVAEPEPEEPAKEAADGEVEDTETSEGRESESPSGGQASHRGNKKRK